MAIAPVDLLCNPSPLSIPGCGRCKRTFTTRRALLRHLRETKGHASDASKVHKIYQCRKCPETFSRDWDRQRHERRWHSDNKKRCVNPTADHRVRLSIETPYVDIQSIASASPGSHHSEQSDRAPPSDVSPVNYSSWFQEHSIVGSGQHKPRTLPGAPIANHILIPGRIDTYTLQRRDPPDDKPIFCTICRFAFDTTDDQQLFKHLNYHFREFEAVNRCSECHINFVQKAELDRHRISAATGHCGYKFHHTKPCTGHHPPGEDHIKLWDRIRHWQQCQLQAYIDRVDELSKRRSGGRSVQTEKGTTCRGCRILEFYQSHFPEEYQNVYDEHVLSHRKSHEPREIPCCQADLTETITEQLLAKLTRKRRRRASSANAEYTKQDTTSRRQSKDDTAVAPIETDPSEILDISSISDPVQGVLLYAACAGDTAMIKACIANGASVHGTDIAGRTAIHWAAASGSCDAVRLLLSFEANIAFADHAGQTPLFLAVECGNADVVEMLLDSGADPTIHDKIPQTCLHLAADSGDAAIVTLLLGKGAKVDDVDCFDRTSLHLAAKAGRSEAVQTLCKGNASIELLDFAGRSPLDSALENNHLDIARYLFLRQWTSTSASDVAESVKKDADQYLIELMNSLSIPTGLKTDRT